MDRQITVHTHGKKSNRQIWRALNNVHRVNGCVRDLLIFSVCPGNNCESFQTTCLTKLYLVVCSYQSENCLTQLKTL